MARVKDKGGRPKGSKNILPQKTRNAIGKLVQNDFNYGEMKRLIAKVERDEGAKAAFQCYVQLLDYTLPKLARVEHTGKDGEAMTLKHILDGISQSSQSVNEKLPMPDTIEADYVISDDAEKVQNLD